MAERNEPLFLARDSYRQRRLRDAARLLPVLGVVLLLLPGFITITVDAIVYIFSVWALLIVAIGLMSRHLANSGPFEDADAVSAEDVER